MNKLPVIAIFDIGKTNKKLFLFDEQYKPVYEQSQNFEETKDEDDFPCENIDAISDWIAEKFREVSSSEDFNIVGVNFSGYGASMVHIDDNGKPLTPLYNYLKPFPENLKDQFYKTYGGESAVAKQTASPVLGNLNSGLQLYRLKYEKPDMYAQIKYSLHLPQYVSFIISATAASDLTSIGCHTHLWDFRKQAYHDWVYKEGMQTKFPPIYSGDKTINIDAGGKEIPVGIGLHDSSSALIPYLAAFTEPFILLSTGTWCISLNPFNHSLLTDYELHQDCLCYLSYQGKPVKASRLFAGYEHEQQVKRLAEHFHKAKDYYKTVKYDNVVLEKLQAVQPSKKMNHANGMIGQSAFKERNLSSFENYETAYHQLILDIILQQVQSTKIILNATPVKRIFVDGGFSQNHIYMHLMAAAFPAIEIFAANIPQASAFGAALAIHDHWNKNPMPDDLINLTHFKASEHISI
ncbi:MAG TPA: FGGY family carbohydrate kinase [Parafilimonas sp.]|nr:FGGY family carbohydrate kinase [Parafilimonas sp.]